MTDSNMALERLQRKVQRHEVWFQHFRQALSGMSAVLSRVERALEREIAQRQAGQTLLQRLLDSHESNLTKLNTMTSRHRLIISLVLWIAGGVAVTALGVYLTRLFG